MEELVGMAVDPIWWVSVVFVGVVVSIFAAYAKNWIDRVMGTFSTAWEQRSARRNRIFWEDVQQLKSSPHLQLLTMSRANYHTSRGIGTGVLAAITTSMIASTDPLTFETWVYMSCMVFVIILIVVASADVLRGLEYKNLVDHVDE